MAAARVRTPGVEPFSGLQPFTPTVGLESAMAICIIKRCTALFSLHAQFWTDFLAGSSHPLIERYGTAHSRLTRDWWRQARAYISDRMYSGERASLHCMSVRLQSNSGEVFMIP